MPGCRNAKAPSQISIRDDDNVRAYWEAFEQGRTTQSLECASWCVAFLTDTRMISQKANARSRSATRAGCGPRRARIPADMWEAILRSRRSRSQYHKLPFTSDFRKSP